MTTRKLHLGIIVLIAMGFLVSPAFAAPDTHDDNHKFQGRHFETDRHGDRNGRVDSDRYADRRQTYNREQERTYEKRGYRYDTRYNHNRYYPPRGYVVKTLPHNHRVIPYHGSNYYFYSGIWYRRAGVSFSVILPPVGIVVPVLPPYYTTVWVGASPYYYADGVYYVWRPAKSGYEVVEAPDDSKVVVEPAVSQELYVYPKEGQNDEQIAKDRYECYRWSVDQTGFDPTQPGGNVSEELHEDKLADYQRAVTACLEGRGYSVK